MSETLRLLLVEDNPGDAVLTKKALGRLPSPVPQVTHLTSLQAAVSHLAANTYDIILTDLDLPDSERLETCKSICGAARGMPVVVLTGSHDSALGLEAILHGAQDYLVKGEYKTEELGRVLHQARQRQLLLMEVHQAKDALGEALTKLRSLEKMREDLMHMIIHDFRSPVFAMRLYLASFLPDVTDAVPADLKADIAKAYDLSGNLVETVSSILDVHRIESDRMPLTLMECDLRSIITEAIEQIAGEADRKSIDMSLIDRAVVCDGSLIRRTVANLVSNALRFSPEGKKVSVMTALVEESIEVSISDEGRGVPLTSQQRIFEKFGSLEAGNKAYSTGLGLPFCKIVIQMHGGEIGVRSEPGKGSTFWFTLPLIRSSNNLATTRAS